MSRAVLAFLLLGAPLGAQTASGPAAADANAAFGIVQLPGYEVTGRQDTLIGIADSASQGTIGAEELAERPILRTGEVLETIPGVIITQHAGGGKANQYFTRGFNLDHGTDFAVDLDELPLNLPSHAHGQGYADLNPVIPELIQRLDFEKGPYFAANGDFSTVGAAHLLYADSLISDLFRVEAGSDGYRRALAAGSTSAGSGRLVYGAEAYHENGPWVVPDDYQRYNGTLKYSTGDPSRGFSILAMAYHGGWNSTDQVAASAVSSGLIPLYGSQSPSDGGSSERYSLQAEWHRQDAAAQTEVMAYAFHYDLNLFSNFTYYLDSPDGDQFEQQDNRNVAGLKASHTISTEWFGHPVDHTFGLQNQDSWIDLGLYQTVGRVRTNKADYAGNPIPAATKVDTVTEDSTGLYYDNRIHWSDKFRSELGLRADLYQIAVHDLVPANSGNRGAARLSPKLNLAFGPWDNTELYAQAGYGFHSNDARAATATVNPDDTPVGGRLPVLVPAWGAEVGLRSAAIGKLQSTLSFWCLHSDSELYFNGLDADSGQTTPSFQSTHRYGVEFSNYYTPVPGLAFDLDYADSWAYFDSPTTAAEDLTPGGTLVDEAIHQSLSAGVTVGSQAHGDATLRLRYFGPRPLTSTGSVRSDSTLILNLGGGYPLNRAWRITAEILNLLNRRDHDIDYYYPSRDSPTAPIVNEDHFHPVEPRELRLALEARL